MTATTTDDIQNIEELIVAAKRSGLSDKEIGDKFGVNFQAIEKAVTKLTGVNVLIPNRQKKLRSLSPKKFSSETTTVWSFKSRGNWATHNGNYRGNWSPYIPRNVIIRYSKEGQLVLDCFCGSGATAVECKLLNRNFIGIDINPNAIELAKENIDFPVNASLFDEKIDPKISLRVGDARDLSFIQDKTIDLICTHPPYADIIQYTDNQGQDLSFLKLNDFLDAMSIVARENFRVLKDGGHCAVLIGDMRKNKNVIPLGFQLIDVYLRNGFVLKELIIKRQHNCRTTGFWYKNSIKYNFLLLAHEYLAIFKKDSGSTPEIPNMNNNNTPDDFKLSENEKLETTTVWIFNPNNWYESTLKNLIKRYDGRDHLIIKEKSDSIKGTHAIIVWDLSVKESDNVEIENIKEIVDHLKDDGYFAVLCNDIRMKDGTVYPTAIHISKDVAKIDTLKIKEVIVVSPENGKPLIDDGNLSISHKYVLVYQKLAKHSSHIKT
jgi:DNA modification methylase